MQDNLAMETVAVPGTISGASIIRDLCSRITAKLSQDCSLRSVDVYSGYSYRVTVELQLQDVYPTTITVEIVEGRIDPKLEVQQVELGSDVIPVDPEQSSLERPIDPDGFIPPAEAAAPAPAKGRLVELPVEAAQANLAPDRGPRDPDYYPPRSDQPLPLRGSK